MSPFKTRASLFALVLAAPAFAQTVTVQLPAPPMPSVHVYAPAPAPVVVHERVVEERTVYVKEKHDHGKHKGHRD